MGLQQGLNQKLCAPRNFAWIITEVCSWVTQPLPLPLHSPGDPLSVKVRSCPFSAQNPPLVPTHSEEQPKSYNSLQDLHSQPPGGSQDSPPLSWLTVPASGPLHLLSSLPGGLLPRIRWLIPSPPLVLRSEVTFFVRPPLGGHLITLSTATTHRPSCPLLCLIFLLLPYLYK